MEFNPQTGIFDLKLKCNLVLKEIVGCIIAIHVNEANPRLLKRLIDATKANMKLSPCDITLTAEANSKSFEKYDLVVDATVLLSPKVTALAMLYQELMKSIRYRFYVFSTRQAAIRWLESNIFMCEGKCLN